MNPRYVWPAVVLAIASALIIAGMAVARVDKDTILLVTGLLLVPVMTSLLAAQGAANATAVQAVQAQTNGNTSRLIDVLEGLGHHLAAATPPAASPDTPSAPSSSTSSATS